MKKLILDLTNFDLIIHDMLFEISIIIENYQPDICVMHPLYQVHLLHCILHSI